MNDVAAAPFADRLLAWFDVHGRKDLPWQVPRSAYRTWISEVMLQQTQVKTVIPYFLRFIQQFPDVGSLAAATEDDVLSNWAGLGYYARGRNLHRAAKAMVLNHGAEVPRDIEALHSLPGIGLSTAGAILAQAHGDRHAILDGNVKRVLARHAGVEEWPGSSAGAAKLWTVSKDRLPVDRLADYTQAIMDLGASLCTTRIPVCQQCPIAQDCVAQMSGRVGALPSSSPKRLRPVRHAILLLIENEKGELLLERRPPSGIWGGLWCPPVVPDGESDEEFTLGTSSHSHAEFRVVLETLGQMRHAFTHFELRLTPRRVRASNGVASQDSDSERWVTLDGPFPALPAPVTRLFRSLQQTNKKLLPTCPERSTV